MNAPSVFTPARDASKVQEAANDGFRASVLQDLLAEWMQLHLDMAMPRYSRATERAYFLAEWKIGRAYARLFRTGDPENVEAAADYLRTYFNFCPDNDCVFDEGALPGPDGFDLAKERGL